jgi:hypothetical protein
VNDTFALAISVLAQEQNRGPDFGKASPVGLVIVLLLLIGTVLLIWSMNKHLRKLPESFERDTTEPDQGVDDDAVGRGPDENSKRQPD